MGHRHGVDDHERNDHNHPDQRNGRDRRNATRQRHDHLDAMPWYWGINVDREHQYRHVAVRNICQDPFQDDGGRTDNRRCDR